MPEESDYEIVRQNASMLLDEYLDMIEPTDGMPTELDPVLMGLFGEVGSVMATAKKYHREGADYVGREKHVVDELGDVLWYFAAICRRLDLDVNSIFLRINGNKVDDRRVIAGDLVDWPLYEAIPTMDLPELDKTLLGLGQAAASVLNIAKERENRVTLLTEFAEWYIKTLRGAGVSFARVAKQNVHKTRGRFLEANLDSLPTFDDDFPYEERIPEQFEVKITQRKNGLSYLQMNDVFIGDPLTDNISDRDDYRFHDVFHLAHAAVLHWSPVFRALIKHKRKSNPEVDVTEDGGRAIVIEEGLTAWIFSRAKELGYFEDSKGVSFDILKTIQQFVDGYEVARCPLKLWEDAILQGYQAFRQVREANGGVLIGDRRARTLRYRALDKGNYET